MKKDYRQIIRDRDKQIKSINAELKQAYKVIKRLEDDVSVLKTENNHYKLEQQNG